MTYTIDDLFVSVNEIFAKYDEGEISLNEANHLCHVNCKKFLDSYCEGEENLRIEIDDISHINE